MTPACLRLDTRPRLPPRARAMAVMAALGAVTALISSLPSPLPDIRLSDPDILINARGVPLHAGIAFGGMIVSMLWLWVSRDPAKCLIAMALTLMGWLAAVNTANDVINAVQGSALFGTVEGAKANREMVAWLAGGLLAGAVGAGLTTFGVGVPAMAIRRTQAWMFVVAVGALVEPPPLSCRATRRHHPPVLALAGCGCGGNRLWCHLAKGGSARKRECALPLLNSIVGSEAGRGMRALATGLTFFAKRAAQAILVMLVIAVIAFAVKGALGDPLREIMGEAVPEAERAEAQA